MILKRPMRARLAENIIVEFVPPFRRVFRRDKVVLICDGLPSVPSKQELLMHLGKNGYWAIHLRYRGTWESSGLFLKESPVKDIEIAMKSVLSGISDVWTGQHFKLRSPTFSLIGSSFGGSVAICALPGSGIMKAIAIAPVCDWSDREGESADDLYRVIRDGYGGSYRFADKGWKRYSSGLLLNPDAIANKIDSKRLLLIHATGDLVVPYAQSRRFAIKTGARIITLRRAVHLSTSAVVDRALWKKIEGFLRDK